MNKTIVSKDRWGVLMAFAFLNFCNAMGFVNLASITDVAQRYYNTPKQNLMMIPNSSSVIYLMFGLLGIPLLMWRLDYSLIASSGLAFASFLIRFLYRSEFSAVLIGSTLNSIAQITILPAYIYVAEVWFPPSQRNLAICVPYYFNLLGLNFGFQLSATLLGQMQFSDFQTLDYQFTKTQLIYLCISAAIFLACILMIKNKPPVSPSHISLKKRMIKTSKSLLLLLSRPLSLFHVLLLSMFLGMSWSMTDVLAIIVGPNTHCNFDAMQIGYLSLIFTVCGIVGGIISAFVIMKDIRQGLKPRYDICMKISLSIGNLALIGVAVLAAEQIPHYWMYACTIGIAGLGINSYLPCACQSILQTLYPMREIVLATVFFMGSNLFAYFSNQTETVPISQKYGLLIYGAVGFIPLIYLLAFYQTQHNKYLYNLQCRKECQHSDEIEA